MELSEFKKISEREEYISKERFWFENNKVQFWYRLYLNTHEFQPNWNPSEWKTRYQVLLVVDDESIHENHDTSSMKKYRFGFFLKEVEKNGKFNENNLEKVLNSALKIKIENKIKVDSYQKIKGIINGTSFYDY